jgi:carbohydrate-binding DOMON domain-containing protein
MKRYLLLAVVLLALIIMPITSIPSTASPQTLISVTDPTGDDKGPGYYGYPSNEVFQPGVFDITGFEVADNGSTLLFKVYVKNLGDNPWGGPNGWCLQFVQIYVRTTQTGGFARMDTMGLNIALRSDYAWHFALMLAPGWEDKPVPVGQRSGLYYANGTIVTQDGVFKSYAIPDENAIVGEVSKSILPDVDNVANWRIVVALAGYDGYGPMRVRTASVDQAEWNFYGTANATQDQVMKIANAISAGIEPRVIDLLVYSDEYNGINESLQYQWLNSFDPSQNLIATVPAPQPIVKTETVTTTVTATTTQTQTQTTTSTVTQKTTETTTATKTSTVTNTYTSVATSTYTTTEKVSTTNWTVAGSVAIILFIIGLVIGYYAKK